MWVMELSGSHSLLDVHKKVTVFGQSDEDYKNLKSVDKNIVLSLQDPATSNESLYEATVIDTGYLSDSGFTFDSRLYAVHSGSARPSVSGPAIPPATIRTTAKSWATISWVDTLVGATFDLPPSERWVADFEVENSPLLPDLKNWFVKPGKPLVQRAVSKEDFERGQASADGESPRLISRAPPSTRKAIVPHQDVLRKKIVRAKRGNGETFVVGRPKKSKDKDEP